MAAPSKRHFKTNAVGTHKIRVTDDWSHHRDVYVETGDADAFRKMLDAITVEDGDGEADGEANGDANTTQDA